MRACELPVPPIAASPHALRRQLERSWKRRQRVGVEHDSDAAPRSELVGVPEKPEACDVRHGVRLERCERRPLLPG